MSDNTNKMNNGPYRILSEVTEYGQDGFYFRMGSRMVFLYQHSVPNRFDIIPDSKRVEKKVFTNSKGEMFDGVSFLVKSLVYSV